MFRGKWEQNSNDTRHSTLDNKNRYTVLPRLRFLHPPLSCSHVISLTRTHPRHHYTTTPYTNSEAH